MPESRPSTLGRPRARPSANAGLSASEEILDAAAALFVEHGFAATTTRAIADRVGIRQSSLYYHFPTKEDIFAALLATTLTASLEAARVLSARVSAGLQPAAALYALAHFDATELTAHDRNAGYLWLLPEARAPRFASFWAQREELATLYGKLGMAAADAAVSRSMTAGTLGAILTQVPELIIHQRRAHPRLPLPSGEVIASTCLRICGLDAETIAVIAADPVPPETLTGGGTTQT